VSTVELWKDKYPGYFDKIGGAKDKNGEFIYSTLPYRLPDANNRAVAVEIGVGYGRYARDLVQEFLIVRGLDIVTDFENHLSDLNITFTLADGDGSIPMENEVADFVYSVSVFQHLDPEQVLKYLDESKRILAKGGTFIHQHVDRLPVNDRCPSRPYYLVRDQIPEWVSENILRETRHDVVYLSYTKEG
jgi:SAM-dependent methyltransferase